MSPEDRKEAQETAPEDTGPSIGPVAGLFEAALPGKQLVAAQGVRDVLLTVDRADLMQVLETAQRDETLAFDYLRDLCGVDFEAEGLEVVYQLYSFTHGHTATVKVRVPTDDARLPTATHLWKGADWHEREVRDMFGIVFDGHPNMVPILLPEDMLDHFPLRKDNPLAPLEEWQGEILGDKMGSAGYIPPGSGFEVEAATEGE